MTFYRSCTGCIAQGQRCATRDALRKQIKGLGITSIKWRCDDRKPKYQVGDPVWVDTIADLSDADYREEFPGVVVDADGARPLVFIDPGSKSIDDTPFVPGGNGSGFCKIPLSRIKARDGDRQAICRSCSWPASKGHQEGYICAVPKHVGDQTCAF